MICSSRPVASVPGCAQHATHDTRNSDYFVTLRYSAPPVDYSECRMALRGLGVSKTTYGIFKYLIRKTGDATYSSVGSGRIASTFGITQRVAQRHLARLEALGFIARDYYPIKELNGPRAARIRITMPGAGA